MRIPEYDVIVVGAGHAGCEAALAAARMGANTMVFTGSMAGVALMPCNPSIGGPAKGNLVCEIDALGGEMGRNTDRALIQIRELNTSKGPAVRALRAQCDKRLYGVAMRRVLENQPLLTIVEDTVEGLTWRAVSQDGDRRWQVTGVRTAGGLSYAAGAVIVTTGTFLKGRLVTGEHSKPGGRAGEAPATELAEDLEQHGFELGRLKTGTPPRVDARTIDFSLVGVQQGSPEPLCFSFDPVLDQEVLTEPVNPAYPHVLKGGWRQQMPCYRVSTNNCTHAVIRDNLHRAPMYNGEIKVPGPRYCPSIEDKVVRFAEKESHTLFLEPEGFATNHVYVQGANTSLPGEVQIEMMHSIPALRNARVLRLGYAVEYDFVRPFQVQRSLETHRAAGLFLAGQINGTTGYEEAAAQGLMAGINATLAVQGAQPLVLGRDQAYIGVMIDDLATRDLTEPYRLHTSRAEFRLVLRHDSADARLTELGHRLGLASDCRMSQLRKTQNEVELAKVWLEDARVPASQSVAQRLNQLNLQPVLQTMPAKKVLRRHGVTFDLVTELANGRRVSREAAATVQFEVKYAGYLRQQNAQLAKARAMEHAPIPPQISYPTIRGMRTEARLRLERFRPSTVAQAARVEGVTPSDIAVLLVHLKQVSASATGDGMPAENALKSSSKMLRDGAQPVQTKKKTRRIRRKPSLAVR
jgi:tRNA uridine 5-carboxymethylaminomethyl modification enzyme